MNTHEDSTLEARAMSSFPESFPLLKKHIEAILSWGPSMERDLLFESCISLEENLRKTAELIAVLDSIYPSLKESLIDLVEYTSEVPAVQWAILSLIHNFLRNTSVMNNNIYCCFSKHLKVISKALFSTKYPDLSTLACELLAHILFMRTESSTETLATEALIGESVFREMSQVNEILYNSAGLLSEEFAVVLRNVSLVLRLSLISIIRDPTQSLTLPDEVACSISKFINDEMWTSAEWSSTQVTHSAVLFNYFLLLATITWSSSADLAQQAQRLLESYLNGGKLNIEGDKNLKACVGWLVAQIQTTDTAWNRLRTHLPKAASQNTTKDASDTAMGRKDRHWVLKTVQEIIEVGSDEECLKGLSAEVLTLIPGAFLFLCDLIHIEGGDSLTSEALFVWSECISRGWEFGADLAVAKAPRFSLALLGEEYVAQGALSQVGTLLGKLLWSEEDPRALLILNTLLGLCKQSQMLRARVLDSASGIIACTVGALHRLSECLEEEGDADFKGTRLFSRAETSHSCEQSIRLLLLYAAQRLDFFCDAIPEQMVADISTIVSHGKQHPGIVTAGVDLLVALTKLYPYALTMSLDFDFLAEHFKDEDDEGADLSAEERVEAELNRALVVGSLRVMTTLTEHLPEAVTLEWIETLRMGIKFVASMDDTMTYPDMILLEKALYECVLESFRVSQECSDYLFDEDDVISAVMSLLQRYESTPNALTILLVKISAHFPSSVTDDFAGLVLRLVRQAFNDGDKTRGVNWQLVEALTIFLEAKFRSMPTTIFVEVVLSLYFPSEFTFASDSEHEKRKLADLHTRLVLVASANANLVAFELFERCRVVLSGAHSTNSAEGENEALLRGYIACLSVWLRENATITATATVRDALLGLLGELAAGAAAAVVWQALERVLRSAPFLSVEAPEDVVQRVIDMAGRFLNSNATAGWCRGEFDEETKEAAFATESLTYLSESLYRACTAALSTDVDLNKLIAADNAEGLRTFLVQNALKDVELASCRDFLRLALASPAVRLFLTEKDEAGYREAIKRMEYTSGIVQ